MADPCHSRTAPQYPQKKKLLAWAFNKIPKTVEYIRQTHLPAGKHTAVLLNFGATWGRKRKRTVINRT